MFVGAAGRRELSLVDELLRQFTQSLTVAQTSRQSVTVTGGDTSKQRQRRALKIRNAAGNGRAGTWHLPDLWDASAGTRHVDRNGILLG